MLKKEVTYTDLDGNKQTDVIYFNMSKAELGRMQVRMDGKYIDYVQSLMEKRRIEALYEFVYNLVLDSYGEKSDDGRRFMKSPEMRWNFECSPAFSEVLMKLLASPDNMAAFVRGVVPPDMLTEAGALDAKAIPADN